MNKTTTWVSKPISSTCEVLRGKDQVCDAPTSFAYPAAGGGWMALCFKHGQKHCDSGGAKPIEELIQAGEKFA